MAAQGEISIRLPVELAQYLVTSLHDMNESITSGAQLHPGPPQLQRGLDALAWDIREAIGWSHLYGMDRPRSDYQIQAELTEATD